MIIVPFEPEHLTTLKLQDMQAWMSDKLTVEYGAALKKGGPAYTGLHDGKVVCCAGSANIWPQRDMVWALLSEDSGPHFITIMRAMKRFLDAHSSRRVEAAVVIGFKQGRRMMTLLGFQWEGRMIAFLPNGADCDLYARINHG